MEKNSTSKRILSIIGTVLFYASFLAYIPLISSGLHGVQSGLFGGRFIYGFEAIYNTLIWFSIVPIIPICAIYQLIFGIVYIRKHKILTGAALIIIAVIITAILSIGFTYKVSNDRMVSEESESIKMALAMEYGDDMTNGMRVSLYDAEAQSYKVTTRVLPQGAEFTVYPMDNYSNDLITTFERCNESFHKDFESYLDSKYNVPDNMDLQVNIISVNFMDYRDGDDYTLLFPNVSYEITGITVNSAELNDDIVIGITESIWKEQIPKLDRIAGGNFLTLNITQNGQYAFSITIFFDSSNPDTATASVTVYSDYTGTSELSNRKIQLER